MLLGLSVEKPIGKIWVPVGVFYEHTRRIHRTFHRHTLQNPTDYSRRIESRLEFEFHRHVPFRSGNIGDVIINYAITSGITPRNTNRGTALTPVSRTRHHKGVNELAGPWTSPVSRGSNMTYLGHGEELNGR